MSLYVSLHWNEQTGIRVRVDGVERELTKSEWDEKFPGYELLVNEDDLVDSSYHDNITHNLGVMARETKDGNLYRALWHPEDLGIQRAAQLIPYLQAGLAELSKDPPRFQKHNPVNGWGNYGGLCLFVARYLNAASSHPEARVSVCP